MTKLVSWKSVPLFILTLGAGHAVAEGKMKVNVGLRAGYHMHMSSDKTKVSSVANPAGTGTISTMNNVTGKPVNNNDELALKDFHLDAAKLILTGDLTDKFGYKFKFNLGMSSLKKSPESPTFLPQIALLNFKLMDPCTLQMGYDQPLVGGLENDAGPVKVYQFTEVQNYLPKPSAMFRLKHAVDEKSFVAFELANKGSAPLVNLVENGAPSSGEVQNQQLPMFGLAWFGNHDLGALTLASNASFHMGLYKEQKDSANGITAHKSYSENYFAVSAAAYLLDNTLDLKPAYLLNTVSSKGAADGAKELSGNVSSFSFEAGYTISNMARPFGKFEMSSLNYGYLKGTDAKTDKIADVTGLSFGLEYFPEETKSTNFHVVFNSKSVKFGEKGSAYGFKHINDQATDITKDKTVTKSEIVIGVMAAI